MFGIRVIIAFKVLWHRTLACLHFNRLVCFMCLFSVEILKINYLCATYKSSCQNNKISLPFIQHLPTYTCFFFHSISIEFRLSVIFVLITIIYLTVGILSCAHDCTANSVFVFSLFFDTSSLFVEKKHLNRYK